MSSLPLPHSLRWHSVALRLPHVRNSATEIRPCSLVRGERILIRYRSPVGNMAIATDQAVHIGNSDDAWQRIRWTDVQSVGWDEAGSAAVLRLWPDGTGEGRAVTVAADRRFGSFAVEAVTASRLITRSVRLTPTITATITALRDPAAQTAYWRVDLSPATARDDPAIVAAARAAVAEMRALTGC